MQLLNLHQRWAPVPACMALCAFSCPTEEHLPQTQYGGGCTHQALPCSLPILHPLLRASLSWSRKDQLMLLSISAEGYKSIYLQECLFLWPFLRTKGKMQPCYFPRQTQERSHPLAGPVSSLHALSSRDSLLLSNTLLQMGKCQFPLCQD